VIFLILRVLRPAAARGRIRSSRSAGFRGTVHNV
jgi:hypothetical protein